jgi:pathogenesis-related protein 1
MRTIIALALLITLVSSALFNSSQKTEILNTHNNERLKAKTPPVVGTMPKLTWDKPLQTIANNYAALCTWKHNANRGSNIGENLYASTGVLLPTTPVASVNSWIAEKSKYTYQKVSAANFAPTGHYTQLIWQTTTKVGCAYQNCNKNSPFASSYGPNWVFVVCDYSTSGNVLTKYPYTAKGYTATSTLEETEDEEDDE